MVLDCIDPNTGGRGNGENLHAFEHGAPEPGEWSFLYSTASVNHIARRWEPGVSALPRSVPARTALEERQGQTEPPICA